MTKSIPESFSLEECLKLYSDQIPEFLLHKLERLCEENAILKTELNKSERSYEVMSEQVDAASELVYDISNFVANNTSRSPNTIREHIRRLIENSYFEM